MKWHTPMGYRIEDGKIIVDEREKEVVTRIFHDYNEGTALGRIADMLRAEQIANGQGTITWTHGSVGRILSTEQYMGNQTYPQIIPEKLFRDVQKRREDAGKRLGRGKYRKGNEIQQLFDGILICGCCDGTIGRFQYSVKSKKKEVWNCRNREYRKNMECSRHNFSDRDLMKISQTAINMLIENPNRMNHNQQQTEMYSKRYGELDRQLEESIKNGREDVMALLYERAEEEYNCLEVQDTEIQTGKMQQILQHRKIFLKDFEQELHKELIQRIIVENDGTAKVIFKNGSSVEVSKQT